MVATVDYRIGDVTKTPDLSSGFQVNKQIEIVRDKVNHAFDFSGTDDSEYCYLGFVSSRESLCVVLAEYLLTA